MEQLPNRIREVRKSRNIRSAELAEIIGVAPPTITRWETGDRRIKMEELLRVAAALDVSLDDLKITPDCDTPREALPIKQRIPLLSTVQAGAWAEGIEFPHDEIEHYPYHKKTSKRAFALRVQGTSMQPTYQPGDIIIINPEKQYKHGSDVVAMQADSHEVTFKRLSIEEGGKMYLKPLNRDFEPRMVLLTGKIIGVCIGRFTEMDD